MNAFAGAQSIETYMRASHTRTTIVCVCVCMLRIGTSSPINRCGKFPTFSNVNKLTPPHMAAAAAAVPAVQYVCNTVCISI